MTGLGGTANPPLPRTRVAGWVLIALAAAFLGWSGWTYWQAGRGESNDFAQERDRALVAGRQQVAALNSMDGRRIDAGLRRWEEVSTGELHDELRRARAQNKQKFAKAGTTAAGGVTDAAVTTLDRRAGTAQVIASVQVKVTGPDGTPTVQRKRYQAGLSLTSAGWKLKSLTAIPVDSR